MASDPRAALTRALALETRNALARIELAASEIDRFGRAPALRLRVETIHSAVSEIDALLEKLDVVSTLAPPIGLEATDLDEVLRRVASRVAPVLRARGLVLERVEEARADGTVCVALPEAVVESIVLGLLGVVSATVETPGLVEMRCTLAGSEAVVELTASVDPGAPPLGPRAEALQLELDVELAEWGGRSDIDPMRGTCYVALPAPCPPKDADRGGEA